MSLNMTTGETEHRFPAIVFHAGNEEIPGCKGSHPPSLDTRIRTVSCLPCGRLLTQTAGFFPFYFHAADNKIPRMQGKSPAVTRRKNQDC